MICKICGKVENSRNEFSETSSSGFPYVEGTEKSELCFTCNYYRVLEQDLKKNYSHYTIIDGMLYTPGNQTSGEFRGMGGRRFDIEYLETSIHAGKKITTWDLWAGAELTEELKLKYPDTAKFLNDAEYTSSQGGTGCWNSSSLKGEPYPLPREIGII